MTSASGFSSLFLVLLLICTVQDSKQDVCNVADQKRVDCGWHGINSTECMLRNCCYRRSVASGGIPWCFYNQNVTTVLRRIATCEHQKDAELKCASNQTIKVIDAFYGRNGDDRSCHHDGHITCFNPSGTDIVKNICNCKSTCNVSPDGDFWNFNPVCDGLNAQLKVVYTCIDKELRHSSCFAPTSSAELPSQIVTLDIESSSMTPEIKTYSVELSANHLTETEMPSKIPIMTSSDIFDSELASMSTLSLPISTESIEMFSFTNTENVISQTSSMFSTKLLSTSSAAKLPVSSTVSPVTSIKHQPVTSSASSVSKLHSSVYASTRPINSVSPVMSISTSLKIEHQTTEKARSSSSSVSVIRPSPSSSIHPSPTSLQSTYSSHSATTTVVVQSKTKGSEKQSPTKVVSTSSVPPSVSSSVVINPTGPSKKGGRKINRPVLIGVSVAVAVLIIIIGIIFFVRTRRRYRQHTILTNDVTTLSMNSPIVQMQHIQSGHENEGLELEVTNDMYGRASYY